MSQTHLSYTSRDFESIKADLVNAIPNLTDIWTSREEADPGMVLITLMAALGDNLSFNMDQQSLEFFGKTFTQRKSASRVLDLIGYKLHWYKSATLEVTVYNNNPIHSAFLQFNTAASAGSNTQKLISSTIASAPSYFLLNPEETASNWDKNVTIEIPAGGSKTLQAVQGVLQKVSFDASAIDIHNRYYISNTKLDQDHIWLQDSKGFAWYQVDNINNLTETAPRFEFGVDEYNLPYIELVPYWKSVYGESHTFTLYYLLTRGSTGNVAANVLNRISGITNLAKNSNISTNDISVVHGPNTVPNTALTNIPGSDPQTAKEAYYDSRNYIGVYNTLVTLQDFEKYMLRLDLISAVKAVDGQYAKEYNDTIPDEEAYNRIYPISYINDSFVLTDGTSNYMVTPYEGTVSRFDDADTLVTYHDTDPEIPGSWFKADKHLYTANKRTYLNTSGAETIGSLGFLHDSSAGDLKVGFNLPESSATSLTGPKKLDFQIKLDKLPTDLSKISKLHLYFEEEGFESYAVDILPAIFGDAEVPSVNYLSSLIAAHNEASKAYSNGFPAFNIQVNTYGSSKCYFRLVCVPTSDSTDLEPIEILLDNIRLFDTDGAETSVDRFEGFGSFYISVESAQLHQATIESSNFIFNLTEPTGDTDNWTIKEFSADNGYTWTTVNTDSNTITLSIKSLGDNTKIENRTFFLQKASENFAPYNLQLHMVAGDFLISSATQASYVYATETATTVETDSSGNPQGYISYQVGDAIVGADSDSLISQTNFDSCRLFNTEIKYGPVRKFPFFIDGQIHLKAPARPAEANLILSKVFAALQTYFNTYNLTMGEKITFNDVIAVIQSADENIDYFDAGANNEHGSLFIYPTTDDYNPHAVNSSNYSYDKFEVNINPKYFNELSLQHYEDMLQANNSIIYWGDTLSKHLSIAADSISEKSTPLTSGISAILSYKDDTGIVTPDPEVVNLYEYNILKNALVDTEHKLVTTDAPETIVIRKSKNFQMDENDKYFVEIPLTENTYVNSPAFRFTVDTGYNNSYLFGYSPERKSFAILDIPGIPVVSVTKNGTSNVYESTYFTVTITNDKLRIVAQDPILNISSATQVYYLEKVKPATHISYYNDTWSEDNHFNNIHSIGQDVSSASPQAFTILYETLRSTDHIWGDTRNDGYISLEWVGCADTIIYDMFNDGYAAALRSKETITSKPSNVIISNYVPYLDSTSEEVL